MKKNYFNLFFISLFAFGIEANAQCISCTTTITGADAASHIVTPGTTLCIAATGTATGLITVSAGGTLCNQGTINSTNLWVAGGTFDNYGSITTTNLLVSSQGVFNNHQSVNVDSLFITNIYSTLNNSGTIVCQQFGVADFSNTTNNGTITSDFLGDSAAQFTNYGNITVNTDFASFFNAGFFNMGYMNVSRDFYNASGATFQTSCMINVGRDWYNSATVLGPANPGCGGFNIAGGSYSSGTIGSASTHIDLCDAGHPAFGIDGPAGTTATTTSYCTCVNACILVGITEPVAQSNVLIKNMYPNPASSKLSIELDNTGSEKLVVEVMDMMGRKQSSLSINGVSGLTTTTIDVSALAQGTYILCITDSQKLQSKSLFSIVK
jgi:hypothetical protein